jgi:hypothetical protein
MDDIARVISELRLYTLDNTLGRRNKVILSKVLTERHKDEDLAIL